MYEIFRGIINVFVNFLKLLKLWTFNIFDKVSIID